MAPVKCVNKIIGTSQAYPTRAKANKLLAGYWKRVLAAGRALAAYSGPTAQRLR